MSMLYFWSSLDIITLFLLDLFELVWSSIDLKFQVAMYNLLGLFILGDTLPVWVFFFVGVDVLQGKLTRFL